MSTVKIKITVKGKLFKDKDFNIVRYVLTSTFR